MKTINLKELRNALSCWQDDYDCDDDKEQYDMFGAAIDAVSRLEAAELEIEGLKRFQELNLKIKQAMHERFTRAERERDELRAEQAEHDEQIARMESKFSLAKRALDSKTARCEKAEAELRRRDAAAGEPVAVLYRNGDVLTKAECGEYFEICCKVETPLYTAAPPAVLPPIQVTPADEWCLDDKEGVAWISGANWMRQQCLELGAQQQQVVVMPGTKCIGWVKEAIQEHDAKWVAALDAAGVKWEVKK